jgi:hypothetical protein
MVDITIYVEGVSSNDPAVDTVGNSAVFRENFYQLFSQKLDPTQFNFKIIPFGTVTQAKAKLQQIETQKINAVLLIDLDAPKNERETRLLKFYAPLDTTKLFFMIQEMEAWILSQVDKIELFGHNEQLTRKRITENISDNSLIKNKHPEEIDKPSEKLDTILRQYFEVKKTGKGKRYTKAKDGPKLIGLLDLARLMRSFDEAQKLVDYIKG